MMIFLSLSFFRATTIWSSSFHFHAFLSLLLPSLRMGGELTSSLERSGNASPSPEPSSSGDRCCDGGPPIRVLVFFHKAFRGELDVLRRLASDAAAADETDDNRRKIAAVELRRRLEFFRSVFRYHCAAEDEVILLKCHLFFLYKLCYFWKRVWGC